jgi:hypothetical protein
MTKQGGAIVPVPNPHFRAPDIGIGLLSRILRIAGINKDDWINA